jgi:hypothetical protein
MPDPVVSHRLCAQPRAEAAASDYEDAAAVQAAAWPVRAAVADGATESVFAGDWARRLADGLAAADILDPAALRAVVRSARSDWASAVRERVADRPWHVRSKVEEGAFATVLALSVAADGRWAALSIGDCGLFHLHNGALRQAWPEDTAEAFTNRPTLVSSRPDRPVPSPDTITGTWAAGDVFVMATDAVAAWLLRTDPAAAPDRATAFAEAVRTARADGALRNDDATLLVLEMPASVEPGGRADTDAPDAGPAPPE